MPGSVWISPETLERIRNGNFTPAPKRDADEILREQAAKKAIEEAGVAICSFCKEEIVKNEDRGIWESDYLLEYCPEDKAHKHKPLVTWTPKEGVVPIEPSTETSDIDPEADPFSGAYSFG